MLEVVDIFRLHGAAYRARCADRLLPSQSRAMHDMQACRTAYFGGHVKRCDHCGEKVYVYHSCGNRTAPNVTASRASAGWIASAPGCCPAPTIWSPLRSRTNSVRWPVDTRRKSTGCSCVVRRRHYRNSRPIRATWVADLAASPCCIPGRGPCSRILTHDAWHYLLLCFQQTTEPDLPYNPLGD